MVVATGKRELKLFGTQSKAIRETAEIDIGTVVGSHLDSLPITIAEPQKEQALDIRLNTHRRVSRHLTDSNE